MLGADYFSKQMARGGQSPSYPIAVAFSGGGDSLALLHLTLKWAAGQPVHALIVDHKLREGSGVEALRAADEAARIGAKPQILNWSHSGVTSGLQDRARVARYDLLGRACRELGAAYVQLGHNQDDQAETVAMRKANGSGWRGLAGIKPISHAPVWPQLRGVSLHRPLLEVTRGQLRGYCRQHGLNYQEDPSNENLNYQRVQVRKRLLDAPNLYTQMLATGAVNAQRLRDEESAARDWLCVHGGTAYAGHYICKDTATVPALALAKLLRNMGGAARQPDMSRVEALLAHLQTPEFKPRTLGGAIAAPHKTGCIISRDPGGVLGGRGKAVSRVNLCSGVPTIWDNRFLVQSDLDGVCVKSLWIGRGQLSEDERANLAKFAPAARRTLPGFYRGDVLVHAPFVSLETLAAVSPTKPHFKAQDLTHSRAM